MIKSSRLNANTDAETAKSLNQRRTASDGNYGSAADRGDCETRELSQGVVEAREERNDPLYYRLFQSFLRGSYEGSINALKLNLVDSETILKTRKHMVEHGCGAGKLCHCVSGGKFVQRHSIVKARGKQRDVAVFMR